MVVKYLGIEITIGSCGPWRCGTIHPCGPCPSRPFNPGELMDRPAKPACNKVKVRALKLLKDMAK